MSFTSREHFYNGATNIFDFFFVEYILSKETDYWQIQVVVLFFYCTIDDPEAIVTIMQLHTYHIIILIFYVLSTDIICKIVHLSCQYLAPFILLAYSPSKFKNYRFDYKSKNYFVAI